MRLILVLNDLTLNRRKLIFVGAGIIFIIYFSLFAQKNLLKDDNGLEPLFSVHLIAPTSSPIPSHKRPAEIIENELPKIGINAELDWISWAALGPRCTGQEVGMYSEGGYDICFYGYKMGTPKGHPGASIASSFSTAGIPPFGYNIPYWSNESGKNYNELRAQENEDIIADLLSELDIGVTDELVDDWQRLWYDVMPNIIIYNQYEVHAISSGLYGYDPVRHPLASIEDQYFISDEDTVTVAVSYSPLTFNSIQENDVYSQYSANIPMDGLVGNTPSAEVFLRTGVNHDNWMTDKYNTTNNLALYPRMANNLGTFSEDGLQFNITVRDDIYWHDGHQFDAYDVAFSFQARLVPSIGASVYSSLLIPFGIDNKTAMSGNYSFIVEDKNSDLFFESISFQFVNTFAPWTTDYLGLLIYPEHILGDPTDHGIDINGDFDVALWLVQPSDWSSHSTSTGRKSDPGGYAGPIGTGSMIFKEYNASTGTITLEKFDDIKWNGDAWAADINNDFYNIVNLNSMPTIAKLISYSLDSAIAKMKTRDVNIIDPLFYMGSVIEELQEADAIQPVLSPKIGWQALYMNPKFVQDGVFHFQKKGVRHAISHIIPRNDIIRDTMSGLGLPGYTPIPITSWAAIPEADMCEYKSTLEATDGSKPEKDATTAYDEYSISVALNWLETEGYNVTRFRNRYTNPSQTTPVWNIDVSPESFIVGSILIAILATYLYIGFSKKN